MREHAVEHPIHAAVNSSQDNVCTLKDFFVLGFELRFSSFLSTCNCTILKFYNKS